MDKRRAERKKELSMHMEDKDNIEDFKIEYGRAIPIIEGIRILNELKERGIANYEDVRKISEVLEILARGF